MKKLLLLIVSLLALQLCRAQVGWFEGAGEREGWTKGQVAMVENGFASLDGSFTYPFEVSHEPDGLFPAFCFVLEEASEVYLAVVDAEGYPVEVLVDAYLPQGCHEYIWNNEDYPEGCYLLEFAGRKFYACAVLTVLLNPEAAPEI